MSWVVVISSPANVPLGDCDTVRALISNAVPDMQWIKEPPILERIKDVPSHPLYDLLKKLPETDRANFARSKLLGDYDSGDFSVQLYGFESRPLMSFSAEIRGNGNPMPLLASICVPNGWIAIDYNNDKQPIDFSAESLPGWDRFRKCRDRVTGRANVREDAGDQSANLE